MRFSEQRAHIGTILNTGMGYVSRKAGLTNVQWLMLGACILVPISLGFLSNRLSSHTQEIGSPSVDATSKDETKPSASTVPLDVKKTVADPIIADPTIKAQALKPTANLAPASSPTSPSPESSARSLAIAAPGPVQRSGGDDRAPAPDAALQSVTLTRIDSLTKAVARMNQKLDELTAKEKSTTARLNAVALAQEQASNAASKYDPPVSRAAPAAKAVRTTPNAEILTVYPPPRARRTAAKRQRNEAFVRPISRRQADLAAPIRRAKHRRSFGYRYEFGTREWGR